VSQAKLERGKGMNEVDRDAIGF